MTNNDWNEGKIKFANSTNLWNKNYIGSIPSRKKRILRRLEGIDRQRIHNDNYFLRKLEKSLWKEFNKVTLQEEFIWFQKSRYKWLKWGDRNTKYFYATAVIRTKRNQILSLKVDDDTWIQDHNILKNMTVSYFENLFKEDNHGRPKLITNKNFPSLSTFQL